MMLTSVNAMLREMVEMRMKEVPQLTLKDVQGGFPGSDRATLQYGGNEMQRYSTGQNKKFRDWLRKKLGGKLTYQRVYDFLVGQGIASHAAQWYADGVVRMERT